MSDDRHTPKLDEAFIRKQADHISDDDIRYVVEHADEIEASFVGKGPLGKFVEELLLSLYIVRDYATGRYRKIPYWAVAAIVFMLLYVGNPVDFVPDFIIGIGQLDDLLVITVCLLMIRQELHDYRHWRETEGADMDEDL